MFFIYRVINNLSPELVSDSFKEKTKKYSLRSNSTLQLPRLGKTTRFGINTVIFKGSLLWNYLPNLYKDNKTCLLYTSPSPRDKRQSRMPSSA